MQAKTHPYSGLSEQEYIALLLGKDVTLMAQAQALLDAGQLVQKLQDDRFTDRQTIREYRQLIWGKASERHVGSLAQLDLDATQPELPFDELPQIQSTITLTPFQKRSFPKR